MEIPSLPTDNLYKFMALAGIVMILLGFGLIFTKIDDLRPKVTEASTQIEVFNLEVDALEKKIEASKKADATSQNVAEGHEGEKQAALIKRAQLRGHVELLASLVSDLWLYWSIAMVSAVLGIAISWFGFRLWYTRVQHPSDMLLRKELERANS